jgi:hypothetical protein
MKITQLDVRERRAQEHQIILARQFVGRPNQDLNDFERVRTNGHRDAARPQFASSEVDLPLPGLIDQD